MKKYVIGIDIDGCLNDQRISMAKILKEDYNLDVDIDNFYEAFEQSIEKEELVKFFRKYNERILDMTDSEKDCGRFIDILNENNFKTEILTARPYMVAGLTISWLSKHKINYDNIFFECDNKVDICQWRGVDVMIEDTPKNIECLDKQNIPVIVFDRPYNRNINCSNIVLRANNWNEICNYIMNNYK